MILTADEITEACVKANYSPNGVSCFFVALNDEWGLKIYHNREGEFNFAYKAQRYLAQFGLCPQVGGHFQIELPAQTKLHYGEAKKCVGYLTEVAEVVGTHSKGANGYQGRVEPDATVRKDHKNLIDELDRMGIVWKDTHWNNVAYLRGKMVVIDTDQYAFGVKFGPKYNHLKEHFNKDAP